MTVGLRYSSFGREIVVRYEVDRMPAQDQNNLLFDLLVARAPEASTAQYHEYQRAADTVLRLLRAP